MFPLWWKTSHQSLYKVLQEAVAVSYASSHLITHGFMQGVYVTFLSPLYIPDELSCGCWQWLCDHKVTTMPSVSPMLISRSTKVTPSAEWPLYPRLMYPCPPTAESYQLLHGQCKIRKNEVVFVHFTNSTSSHVFEISEMVLGGDKSRVKTLFGARGCSMWATFHTFERNICCIS